MLAMPVTDSTSAGRNKCHSLSSSVTSDATTPDGAASPMGNHPSCTEKNTSARSASQNVGAAESTRQNPFTRRSVHVPCLMPHKTPSAKPKTPDSTHAVPMRASEVSARSAMTSSTGRWYITDTPQSPASTPPIQLK